MYIIFKYYLDKLPAVELTSTFLHGVTEPDMLTVRTTEVPPINHVNNQKAYSAKDVFFKHSLLFRVSH
jgi:hypothetical protein